MFGMAALAGINRIKCVLAGCLLGLFILIVACTGTSTPYPITLDDISWTTYKSEQFGYELRIPSYGQVEEREDIRGVNIDLNPKGIGESQKGYRGRLLVVTYDQVQDSVCRNPIACFYPWDIYSCNDPGETVMVSGKTYIKKTAPFTNCMIEDCSFWMSYSKVGSSACVTLTFIITIPYSYPTQESINFHFDEVVLFEEIVSSLVWNE
jgi:hypothetical protein